MDKIVLVDPNRKVPKELTARKISEDVINEMINLYNNGYSQKALSEKYNISKSTVKRYIRERKEMRKIAEGYEDKMRRWKIEYMNKLDEDRKEIKELKNKIALLEAELAKTKD